jgi:hypothetical protein
MELIDIATERSTAGTDVILALLALAALLYIRHIGLNRDPRKSTIWAWAFGLLSFSSIVAAWAHGFKMSETLNTILWQPINLGLGLTVAMFAVGVVYDLCRETTARRVLPIFIIIALVFYGLTWVLPGGFLVFVIYEAIAMLFALGAYIWLATRGRLTGAWTMAAGILITILAAAIQATELVSFTLIWEFDHNGTFHLVQMVGLVVLVAGLRAALLDRE